jgi:hypothetical protein
MTAPDPLRLEADDHDVLARTGLALQDANAIPDPPLRLLCRKCGAQLAQAGDTAHGPLFTSTWEYEPELGHVVTVNGRTLNRRETIAWREANETLAYREGSAMTSPLAHGVRALLTPGLSDYPDLLVRCTKDGDAVLNRDDVLAWIREAALKPMRKKVAVAKPFSAYRHPQPTAGPSAPSRQREVWRPKFDSMTIEEYEQRKSARDGAS